MVTLANRFPIRRAYLDCSRLQLRSMYAQGVTLLETLIALFVVAVGVLGLAALIPVGRWQMEEALRIDRGATLGRLAFRNLASSGHLNIKNWTYAAIDAKENPLSVVNPATNTFRPVPFGSGDEQMAATPPRSPLVLDPLLIGYQNVAALGPEAFAAVKTFPYKLPGTSTGLTEYSDAPSLARISLANPVRQPNVGAKDQPPMLPMSSAEVYFRGSDDVRFAFGTNREIKPSAMFSQFTKDGNSNSNAFPASGQTMGDFSWLAFVKPMAVEASYNGPLLTRQFEATIVVFHKRLLRDMQGMTFENRDRYRGERRAKLDFFTSGTYTQGSTEAWMTMSDLRNDQEANQATSLHNGEWLVVMAYVPMVGSSNSGNGNGIATSYIETQFFRVLSVGRKAEHLGGNVWRRRIRLTGGNWTVPPTGNSSGSSSVAPGYAVIFDGAVAVYRKTFVFDSRDMWSQ